MTDQQWRELVQAMHAVDQNIMVITMMFNNHTQRGLHKIETEGYRGIAFYPSKLSPDRMPIASKDPLEAILSEADRLGMHVMPGVGCYAFFDFTPGSLRWHKQVADELWQRYGRHPSFFRNTWELHPRPIEGLVSDLSRFQNFEKILHYEFPGMMSSPKMSRQPGGPASVRLYKDYERAISAKDSRQSDDPRGPSANSQHPANQNGGNLGERTCTEFAPEHTSPVRP